MRKLNFPYYYYIVFYNMYGVPWRNSISGDSDYAGRGQLSGTLEHSNQTKMTRSNGNAKPWVTRETRRMSKKKQRLYNQFPSGKSSRDWKAYRDYQKTLSKKLCHNYWSFQNGMFKDRDDKSC